MSTGRAVVFAMLLMVALFGCSELLPPGFPHRAHLTEENCGGPGQSPCPTCTTCHADAQSDFAAGPPGEHVCRGCHGTETETVLSRVRSGTQKRTEITFSHASHLGRGSIRGQCVGCHEGVSKDGVHGGVYPDMATCIDCHEDGLSERACTQCHAPRDLGKLVPETFLRHDGAFYRNHGMLATQHQDVCTTCHAQNSCTRCHDQNQPLGLQTIFPDAIDRPLIHRADFVVRHAIEARSERGDCARCHTVSYCDACHVERGVSANRLGALNPHPVGWVGPDGGSANHHGRAAKRDIFSCASCHDAGPATNCIRCHQVGGPGGNPHPGRWRSFRSLNEPMCRYCHAP